MSTQQIYMRFLNLVHALEGNSRAPAIDLDAKKLLDVIGLRFDQRSEEHTSELQSH